VTNVKVGDMAQVIRATPTHDWMVGRVVKIAKACCFSHAVPSWQFEQPLRHGIVKVGCAPDSHLKRIDPLSDDEGREERAQQELPRPRQRRKEISHAVDAAWSGLGTD
jgi:hypothetical protein